MRAENRIIQVDGTLGNCSTATACYVYNAEGQRVRKTTGSSTMDYLYDLAGHKVAEVNPTGVFMLGELYAGGRHYATYAPGPGPTGATFFTHGDWLETERARTDMTGTTCESIGSLPFGDGQSITGTCGDVSPMHFTGKERDSESGLDNFTARYFGSRLGRFISPDDTDAQGHVGNPQGLNLYSYVQNNPTNATDPDGHDCVYINDNSASVTRGDCGSNTDNGIFVNGTIDTKSGSYNSSTGTLSFNYTNDDTGAIGKGVIGDVYFYPSGGGSGVGSEAGAVAIFSDINRRNILGNTAKIYGAGAAIGLTGGAACYYLCPAATVTTLGIAASPLLPIVPSAIQKLQQLGISIEEANAIVKSPASQKLIDTLNSGNINVIQDVGGKLVRITLDPSGQRIISAGLVRANQITNGIASGRFVPK